MSDALASAKPIPLWPYVVQFGFVYLVATAAVVAVTHATDWQTNRGVNIAIVVASVVLPMHSFVRDQKRPLTRREQFHFATLAFVASTILSLAVSALTIAVIAGPEYIVSLVSGFQYVGPGYLIAFVVMLILFCLVIFAVLCFVSGLLSRAFHRQLTRRGAL